MTKNKEIKAKKRVKAVTESVNTFNIRQSVIHEGKKHVVLAIFSTFNIQDNDLGKDPVVYSLCEVDNIKNIPVSREKFIFKTFLKTIFQFCRQVTLYHRFDIFHRRFFRRFQDSLIN